jgi:hypothetical protein
MKALFVTQFTPRPVGHGGDHRAYQIVHDLGEAVGPSNVVVASAPLWHHAHSAAYSSDPILARLRLAQTTPGTGRGLALAALGYRALRRVRSAIVGNTSRQFSHKGLVSRLLPSSGFTKHCEQLVEDFKEPAVCIIEHAGFGNLIESNQFREIPTIGCIANIESFDGTAPVGIDKSGDIRRATANFADEFGVLSRCAERLFISKVEAALIGGLGLPSHYYPYRPVGAIRESSVRIRQARAMAEPKPGLFLMLGTAGHRTTRASMSWFIESAHTSGLPEGIGIVVAGGRTNELLPSGTSVPGIELRGWVEQDELDRLLTQVRGVLLPQRVGFGAVTRLAELACSGIPSIASRHATYAVDPTPGLHAVDDTWEEWSREMVALCRDDAYVPEDAYLAWEARQENTLGTVVGQMRDRLG